MRNIVLNINIEDDLIKHEIGMLFIDENNDVLLVVDTGGLGPNNSKYLGKFAFVRVCDSRLVHYSAVGLQSVAIKKVIGKLTL